MGAPRVADSVTRDPANAERDEERLLQMIEDNTNPAGTSAVNTLPAISTDANGTVAQYLRGIVKLLVSVIDATLNALIVRLKHDAANAALWHIDITLDSTVETVTRVAIPDSARGVKLYSISSYRFGINEDPTSPRATDTNTTHAAKDVAVGALGVGGIGIAGTPEIRLVASGAGRKIHLRSSTASALISVEFF